jgi:hypothetical protein
MVNGYFTRNKKTVSEEGLIMNILIMGSRKTQNAADLGYPAIKASGHNYVYLYKGDEYPYEGGIQVDRGNIEKQVHQIISQHDIDVLFFRAEWFDAMYQEEARCVFSLNLGIPRIFGYHCHTSYPTELEKFVFSQADAFVLLNKEALTYFSETYGVSKPYFLMPSLFLPPRSWYDRWRRLPKLSASDGEIHCVIPSAAIRLSGLPNERHQLVPMENYLCDRYDYYQIVQKLAESQIHVHVYGQFVNFSSGYSSEVDQVYRDLEASSPYIHFEEKLAEAEFTMALSQYDFAILTGFLPRQIVPKFDHMNYQLRFNSVLAAGLPIFVAQGTSAALEREISSSGAGLVFDTFENLKIKASDPEFMHSATEAAISLHERHSFEAWVNPLVKFFQQVINETDVPGFHAEVESANCMGFTQKNRFKKRTLNLKRRVGDWFGR